MKAAKEVEEQQKKDLKLAGLDLSQYSIKGSEDDWQKELSVRGKSGFISIKGYERMNSKPLWHFSPNFFTLTTNLCAKIMGTNIYSLASQFNKKVLWKSGPRYLAFTTNATSAKSISYRPPTKLQEGNVFSQVFVCSRGDGLGRYPLPSTPLTYRPHPT